MKTLPADLELARRFPKNPKSGYSRGETLVGAKVSPSQLARLLHLGLIKQNGECGMAGTHAETNRYTTCYLRTFD